MNIWVTMVSQRPLIYLYYLYKYISLNSNNNYDYWFTNMDSLHWLTLEYKIKEKSRKSPNERKKQQDKNIALLISIYTQLYIQAHPCLYYKLYRFLTVYMGSYTRLELIWNTRRKPRGYVHSSRVHESINTVKNLYNDFIILQDVFLAWKLWFVYIFTWEFGIIYKLPNSGLIIQHRHENSLSTYDAI